VRGKALDKATISGSLHERDAQRIIMNEDIAHWIRHTQLKALEVRDGALEL
jgi:hypothetical protein